MTESIATGRCTVDCMKHEEPRNDRTAFSVVSFEEQATEERTYWHDKTPRERLEALELTRQLLYGYDPATARVERVIEVVARD